MPRQEVTESEAYKNNPAAPFFLAELKKARFAPRVVGYNQVVDAILRGRDAMMQGQRSRQCCRQWTTKSTRC